MPVWLPNPVLLREGAPGDGSAAFMAAVLADGAEDAGPEDEPPRPPNASAPMSRTAAILVATRGAMTSIAQMLADVNRCYVTLFVRCGDFLLEGE